ncbi:MAG: thermonuclease family protein [Pirellulales bacterium]
MGFRVWQLSGDQTPEKLDAGEYPVVRVTDGDTLRLTNGARVRLIGIDTPETRLSPNSGGEDQPFAQEAKAFVERATEDGKVRLEFDKERIDKYGRFLAYVWYVDRTSEEELLLNEELLRAGLAKARLGYSYSDAMKRRFRAAELEAREARRGVWVRREAQPQSNVDRFSTHRFAAKIGRFSRLPNPGLPALHRRVAVATGAAHPSPLNPHQ